MFYLVFVGLLTTLIYFQTNMSQRFYFSHSIICASEYYNSAAWSKTNYELLPLEPIEDWMDRSKHSSPKLYHISPSIKWIHLNNYNQMFSEYGHYWKTGLCKLIFINYSIVSNTEGRIYLALEYNMVSACQSNKYNVIHIKPQGQ